VTLEECHKVVKMLEEELNTLNKKWFGIYKYFHKNLYLHLYQELVNYQITLESIKRSKDKGKFKLIKKD
jgi:hypothetical protein